MKKLIYFFITIIIFLGLFLLLEKIEAAQAADNFNLSFSTYIGGTLWENIRSVTTDPQGYIYITGGTNSSNYPTTFGPSHQSPPGTCINSSGSCSDIFVTKLTPDGKQIVWSRLIGTNGHDRAYGIKYDATGYLLLHGRMSNGYTMTSGVIQPTFGGWGIIGVDGYGPQNGFIGKLDPSNGNIIWISYIGSASLVRDANVDELGNVYVVTGYEPSLGSPWRPDQQYPAAFANAYRKTPYSGGVSDSVIFKINPNGTQILWGTYFGGSGSEDAAQSIGVHRATKNVYISGQTQSTDLPGTANVFSQGKNNHGGVEYFVAKFSSDGSSLFWSAYLGGSGNENHNSQNLVVDQSTGDVYVSPFTGSANYPTTSGAFQTAFGGGYGDVAISKISSDGTTLLASTFVGGSSNDNSDGLILDSANHRIYFTGNTGSTNFPLTANAYQSTNKGGSMEGDAFVSVMSDDLSQLLYSTYLGGSDNDSCRGSTVDASGNFLCGGMSYSTNFPILNAFQSSKAGDVDNILVKFIPSAPASDTQAPSIPANLTASVVSSSQINLSWTASTDNVGVTGYRVYRNGSQINTTTNTSYSDTGLTANATYSYTVAAYDVAGNISSQSTAAQATTLAGGATTIKFYSGAGDGRVTYTVATSPGWDIIHDAAVGSGISYTSTNDAYATVSNAASWPEVTRTFFPIDTSAIPDNAIITSATLYLYPGQLDDGDNDGNDFITVIQASQANPASLTVNDFNKCGATNNPTEGANRIDITNMSTSAYSAWTLNSTGLGWISKTGYTLLCVREGHDALDDIPVAFTRARFYASEQAGTSQDPYLEVTYTVSGSDTQAPTVPTNLSASAISSSQINLSWSASTDNIGVSGYRIYRNLSQINTTANTSYSDIGLSPSTTYNYTVAAYDVAGNVSNQCSQVSATTQSAADTTPPVRSSGSPSGTLPSGTTQTTLSLSTNENATCKYSTVANTAYASISNTFSTTGGTSHSTTITGLSNGNAYNYYIRCLDTAGNANTDDFQISFFIAQSGSTACSWNGNTGTVASPYAASDVQACITDAAGKTGAVIIQIPDSSVTWASSVSVDMQSGWANVTKLTLKGQNNCTLTTSTNMVPSGNNFQYPTSCGTNIANFVLYYTGKQGKAFNLLHLKASGTSGVQIDGDSKSWRFGYIIWENITGPFSNRIYRIIKNTSHLDWLTEGLIDHNYATIPVPGTQFVFWYIHGNAEWIAPFDLGGSSAAYLENNRIVYSSGGGYTTDNDGGGRYVIRYNEIINGMIGGHDDRMRGSGMRGSRKAEVYGNYFNLSAAGNYWIFYMAGNGVFFNNTVIKLGQSLAFDLHVSRAEDVGGCNSTSGNDYLTSTTYYPTGGSCTLGVNGCIKIDGSASSPSGYPCRDQIGASGNDPQVGGGQPFLLWGNTIDGGAFLTPGASSYVVQNTDWCTASTCSGTTCSYTCGATTVNYAAYAYPHLLTLTGGDTTPPASPTGVTVN